MPTDVDTSPAALRALAEAATPGPWQVDITRHPYSMVRLDGSLAEGEHVERWIQSVRIDPQAKAPHPIVVRSVGIAHPGEPPIPMVHIRPEDADYLAAVSPEVVLALLDENAAIRARLAAAEQERDVALRGALEFNAKVGAGFARDEEYLRLHREKMDEFHKRIAAESRVKMAERDRGALIAALDHLLYPKPASGTRVYTLPDGQRECLTAKQFNEACARQLLQTLATQDLLAMAPEVETAPDQPEDPAHD